MVNLLLKPEFKKSKYGGRGYIAGNVPGVVLIDGSPGACQLELRLRHGHRNIVQKTFSNSTNGTYRFNDLNPFLEYDLIARNEPTYTYRDLIFPGIFPWVDNEIIAHGNPLPNQYGFAFSRVFYLVGGEPPYSINVGSVIPTGTTVDLTGQVLSISATAAVPGVPLSLIVEDTNYVTLNFSINI